MPIQGVGKNEISENGLVVQKMLHKRLGLQDLFNYSLDFTGVMVLMYPHYFLHSLSSHSAYLHPFSSINLKSECLVYSRIVFR